MTSPGQRPFPSTRFRRALLRWYRAHRRQLAWRGVRDSYRIWVSEIMLQQTRVAVVEERYPEFLRRFPNVRSLARARRDAVLAAWGGLGYYRRARNLHAAARVLARNGGARGAGVGLPRNAEELRRLPGIGRYTAAAIASIAFGQPVAAVDGNVERVLGRVFALPASTPASRRWQLAQQLLDAAHPGDFNQAMMELGATTCLPAKPQCKRCPVAKWCAGRDPLPGPGRLKAKRRLVRQRYLLIRRRNSVYLVRRPGRQKLMPGMWELPRAQNRRGVATLHARHSITTTDFHVAAAVLTRPPRGLPAGKWVPVSRLSRLPLTGLARKLLRLAGSGEHLQ